MSTIFECDLPDIPFNFNLEGLYLLLINVNQGPPHIALVFNNKYYSVNVNTVSRGSEFSTKLNSMLRKKHPLLFIELVLMENVETVGKNIANVFNSFRPLSGNGNTCLLPVKMSLELMYTLNSDAQIVAELLNELRVRKLIRSFSSPNILPGEFQLKPYTINDVEKRIKLLLNKTSH